MKLLVTSLLQSMPALLNVIVLLAFVFAIFGILGLQIWCVMVLRSHRPHTCV